MISSAGSVICVLQSESGHTVGEITLESKYFDYLYDACQFPPIWILHMFALNLRYFSMMRVVRYSAFPANLSVILNGLCWKLFAL